MERSNLEFPKGTNETHNVTRKQVKFYKRIQKILLKTHKPQCKRRFTSKIPKPTDFMTTTEASIAQAGCFIMHTPLSSPHPPKPHKFMYFELLFFLRHHKSIFCDFSGHRISAFSPPTLMKSWLVFQYVLQLSINSTILCCILLLEKKISFLWHDTGSCSYLYEFGYQFKSIE